MTGTNTSIQGLYAQLRSERPFASLPEQQFAGLLAAASLENVAAGDVLISQGDLNRDYLVLLEGEVEIRRIYQTEEGTEELEVGRLSPGHGMGEIAVLYGVPRQANVRAVVASRFLRINGDQMEELLAWSQRFSDELVDQAQLRSRMNLVRRTGPFRSLPLERVRMAFECMQPLDVQAGTTVVRAGEAGDCYYIIESGQAEVWRTDPLSGDTARVAVLGAGDAFGEEALLLGGFRNATINAITTGRLWTLSKENFESLLRPFMVAELDAAQAQAMVQRGDATWLDCRYDIEFDEAHIPGAALAPLDDLREQTGKLDKDRTYIVYCRSGRRSACGAYLLRERGFRAYTLVGGVRDWPYALQGESIESTTTP